MNNLNACLHRCSKFIGLGWALIMVIATAASSHVLAESSDDVLDKLKQARPDFKFEAVKPTPANGIYQANIVGGPTIYITEDGKHFFSGDFFQVDDNGIVNLADLEMEQGRKEALANVALDEMIIFKANGDAKQHIYVFTDVDCYYCQKLHQEMAEMNELGIEVRYLAYPRAGIGSPSYRKVASAWCADDPNEALTQLKS